MVYEVSGAQELTQKNVQTLTERCLGLVTKAAVFEPICNEYILPVLKYYSEQKGITLQRDPVTICWNLLRQGGLPCALINKFRGGTIGKIHPLVTKPQLDPAQFMGKEAQENIRAFTTSCRDDLFRKDDEMFDDRLLYTEDTNTLAKMISITDYIFERINRVQRINFAKKIEELRAREPLFQVAGGASESSGEDGGGGAGRPLCGSGMVTAKPTENRLRVLYEMLETEHQYVADLEKLQSYAEELRIDKIISPQSQAKIFSNLNALVDFQRRFALQMQSCVSGANLKDLQSSYECHVGKLFIDNERLFSVYEEFCANQKQAQTVIDAEKTALMAKQNVLDPNVVVSYLIKPIQRICKYPLLLRELNKMSPPEAPDREEVNAAFEAITRAAKRVNELERQKENQILADELKANVADWKQIGRDKNQIGTLLLYEKTNVMVSDSYKEMGVYLFSEVLLLVRETRSLIRSTKAPLTIRGAIWPELLLKYEPITEDAGGMLGVRLHLGAQQLVICLRNAEMAKLWIQTIGTWAPKADGGTSGKLAAAVLAPPSAPLGAVAARQRRARVPSQVRGVLASGQTAGAYEESDAPTRVKIVLDGEMYIRVVPELTSLEQLRQLVLDTVKPDYENGYGTGVSRTWDFPEDEMRLKYADEFKDLINLANDQDLETALDYCPNYIAVHLQRAGKAPSTVKASPAA